MKEDCGLGHGRLLQGLVCATEHDGRNVKAQHLVGLLKSRASRSRHVVKVFAHAWKLGALAREHKSSHVKKISETNLLQGFVSAEFQVPFRRGHWEGLGRALEG